MANRFNYPGASLIGLTAIMFPGTMRIFSETDLIQVAQIDADEYVLRYKITQPMLKL